MRVTRLFFKAFSALDKLRGFIFCQQIIGAILAHACFVPVVAINQRFLASARASTFQPLSNSGSVRRACKLACRAV